MTPFGMPVDPLVYMMTAMSEGSGGLRSRAAVIITEKIAQARTTAPTRAGRNVKAAEIFKGSEKHVWRKVIFRCFQTKAKSATGCSAGAASGIGQLETGSGGALTFCLTK